MDEKFSFLTRIDHDFGYYLDVKYYAPLTQMTDESAVLTKLSLIHENFLLVFINNVRKKGTERFVYASRKYFTPKLETAVALGLPVSLAVALAALNTLRNKYAHDIGYIMTDKDMDVIEKLLPDISIDEINFANAFNRDSIMPLFSDGIRCLEFIRAMPFAISEKQKRGTRLVAIAYALSNFCTFFMVNLMVYQGTFKTSKVDGHPTD